PRRTRAGPAPHPADLNPPYHSAPRPGHRPGAAPVRDHASTPHGRANCCTATLLRFTSEQLLGITNCARRGQRPRRTHQDLFPREERQVTHALLRHHRLAAAVVLAIATPAAAVHAQDTAPADAEGGNIQMLDEIRVTAERR